MMKNAFRSFSAVFVSFSLIGAAPGPRAYAATAKAFVPAAAAVAGIGAPAATPLSLVPLSAPVLAPLIPTAAMVGARAPIAAAADAEKSARTAFEGLAREIPEFNAPDSGAVRESAEDDFLNRVGSFQARQGEDAVLAGEPVPAASPLSGQRQRTIKDAAPAIAARLAPAAAAMAGMAASINLSQIAVYFIFIIPSLILHEMGHAWAAAKLGDPTSKLEGRLSFKPKNLLTHIDPTMTIAVPLFTLLMAGFLFGGARPVPVNPRNFNSPVKDMAKVALAGPAVNFLLALSAGAIHAACAALGVGGPLSSTALELTVFYNVMLGVFNLLPFAPLDGHHVVRYALDALGRSDLAARLDANRNAQMIALFVAVMALGAPLMLAIRLLTRLFLFGGTPPLP